MDRFRDPLQDGFDFKITSFEKNPDGTASASGRCINGARIDVDLTFCLEDGEDPLVKADISVDAGKWGSSGEIYDDLSIKEGITADNVERCLRAFMYEKLYSGF